MRLGGFKSFAGSSVAFLALALFLSAAAAPPRQSAPAGASAAATGASAISLKLDSAQSKVNWSVPSTLHEVHGTFAVTKGEMQFDPGSGAAHGEIVVNARSGESGNSSRDERMHKEILETTKFPEVVFHPTKVQGRVPQNGPCEIKLRGILSIHGSDHEITTTIHGALNGKTWKGTGEFDVPYVDWGIKNPSNFFLKVNHVVHIEIEMIGSVEPAV